MESRKQANRLKGRDKDIGNYNWEDWYTYRERKVGEVESYCLVFVSYIAKVEELKESAEARKRWYSDGRHCLITSQYCSNVHDDDYEEDKDYDDDDDVDVDDNDNDVSDNSGVVKGEIRSDNNESE